MNCGPGSGENGDAGRVADAAGTREGDVVLRGPVLVVEDNPSDRRVLGQWFEDLGLSPGDIELVNDEAAAVAAALDRPPRVLVCDWLLPGGPASSLIDNLRRLHPELITVVLSEHVDRARELSALACGAHEVLAKAECSAMTIGHALRRAERRLDVRRQDDALLEQFERASRNAHIAGMSRSLVHDIKNLMMATSANLEIIDLDLEELVASALTEDTRQRAHDAQLAVEQVAEICDDLVRYASAAEQPAERVEVTEAVQAAVRLLPRDARKRIDVLVAAEGAEELNVELDPMALRQVVYNLLLNAVDATAESGKVTVEVGRWEDATALDGHVVASPARGAPLTFMRVSNDGQTLPASLVREVFQPFFSTKTGSRGLGLPAVLRAVRFMGGGLSLSTGPNRTTFTVAFPADDPDSHQLPVH